MPAVSTRRSAVAISSAETFDRKFGKQIQKRQLEVPEYAASFVNYKALKKVSASKPFCSQTLPAAISEAL